MLSGLSPMSARVSSSHSALGFGSSRGCMFMRLRPPALHDTQASNDRPGLRTCAWPSHLHHELAGVLAGEEHVDRGRGREESLHQVHAIVDLAFRGPHAELQRSLGEARQEIDHDEALHAEPLGDDPEDVARAGRALRLAVSRDHPARDDAAEVLHVLERGVEDVAADVVEVDVDAFRTRLTERTADVARFVVDAVVEPELVDDPAALLLAARDADDAAPEDLADLARDRADAARRARHHERLARLRLPDVGDAEVRGDTGVAMEAHGAAWV